MVPGPTPAEPSAPLQAGDKWIIVAGVVVEGHRVARSAGASSPYPEGTIPIQLPYFQRLGLDLSRYYPATLNVSIAPRRFAMVQPGVTFRQVRWTSRHPPEDFSFSPCRVDHGGQLFEGLIYYPHPETKARHFQDPSTLEVITTHIPGIVYGSGVRLHLRREEINILPSAVVEEG